MIRINSKVVADWMGKRHDNLMRAIRTDSDKLENPERYYKKSVYTDGKGQERECYEISIEGCERLSKKIYDARDREDFLSLVRERERTAEPVMECYTVKEAAKEAGVSERQVQRWIASGKLSAEKQTFTQTITAHRNVIKVGELERFLKERGAVNV